MKRTFSYTPLVLVLSVILTACVGSASPSRSINVTMTDFTFSPNKFTVPADGQISINATNNGAVIHSFIIMKLGQDVQTHFTDFDKAHIYWEVAQIAPGQSVTETFTAPSDPGEYQVVCGEAGHFEAGMVARLIVAK